jgi:3'-phosphoadenosine 5'-phosphosulfate sulfotransferase (PAPS reductase)/FAD synthetase
MQSWSLERKIQVTQTRIIEWYNHYKGNVYVSFSGGKDSTVLLDLSRRIYPDIEAVFIDTGLEYPELREFVKTMNNVTWLKPEMNFKQVINTYGYPLVSKHVSDCIALFRKNPNGCRKKNFDPSYKSTFNVSKWTFLRDSDIPISNKCCDIMKKKPVKKFEKLYNKKPILATMTEEGIFRKAAWLKNGCNAFDANRPISTPMSFWTEQDVLKYLKDFNIPYASVYGDIVIENEKYNTTGYNRTGCIFCAYGCHLEKEPNRFQMLKKTHPKLWEYCMKPVSDGGLGMKEILKYIGVKIE